MLVALTVTMPTLLIRVVDGVYGDGAVPILVDTGRLVTVVAAPR